MVSTREDEAKINMNFCLFSKGSQRARRMSREARIPPDEQRLRRQFKFSRQRSYVLDMHMHMHMHWHRNDQKCG